MVDRIVGPRGGVPLPRGPEPKKAVSRELRENVDDTKAVAARVAFTRFEQKLDGYTKGPVNMRESRRTGKAFDRTPKFIPSR